ncbi:transcriptional regulator, HxlR family [Frankineae bacterium MT45]|nr:transcriptional regulator, HxlR family [Frankineae bacterium MT45]
MTTSETPLTTSLTCDGSLDRAFHFLGKRWNGVILASLFDGPATFSNLSRGVTGISDSMLSDRLGELGRAGLVKRTVAEGPPVMVVYELSPSGQALLPALQELAKWASANLTSEACSQAPRGTC